MTAFYRPDNTHSYEKKKQTKKQTKKKNKKKPTETEILNPCRKKALLFIKVRWKKSKHDQL